LFDREEMNRLFSVGYELARDGYRWRHAPRDVVTADP
jgi:hypothetical protein